MKRGTTLILIIVCIGTLTANSHAGWFKNHVKKTLKKAPIKTFKFNNKLSIPPFNDLVALDHWVDDNVVEPADKALEKLLDAHEVPSCLNTVVDSMISIIDNNPLTASVLDVISQGGLSSSGGLSFAPPNYSAGNSGTLNILTWNVWGLPEIVGAPSDSSAEEISRLLESQAWDIAALQEDFVNHKPLMSQLTTQTYPYRSLHYAGTRHSVGNGLLTLSNIPFDNDNEQRYEWSECHGASKQLVNAIDFLRYFPTEGNAGHDNCLTEKGFSITVLHLGNDLEIHLYNLHGNTGNDLVSNRSNLRDVTNHINSFSLSYPVIVAGDFNMRFSRHEGRLTEWMNDTGLTFTCIEADPNHSAVDGCGGRVDLIAYRESNEISFTTLSDTTHEHFISDHKPRSAVLLWERTSD